MDFWEKVRKDVQKSFKDGMAVIKVKAGELSEEGKKRYKAFDLKHRVHKHMSELGGQVYSLKSSTNPLADPKVKAIMEKIGKLEDQINKLESELKKTPAKKKATKKPGSKKK
jgi:polyhydroxyalkanoate synthesis regulator phasin